MPKDKKYYELREKTENRYSAGDRKGALKSSRELDAHLNKQQKRADTDKAKKKKK